MKENQWHRIRSYFDVYAESFLSQNLPEDFPLKLKYSHSIRVSADCGEIAAELGWNPNDVLCAKTAGILHDIGRFTQFREFKTFLDSNSIDHGLRSYEVTDQSKILDGLSQDESSAILDAIKHHNKRHIPDFLPDFNLKLLNLVRDSDKLDIIQVVSDTIKNGWHNEHPAILLQVDTEGSANPVLIKEILDSKTGSYENVKSLADVNLIRMAWVFNLNYKASIRRFAERGFMGLASPLNIDSDNRDISSIQKMIRDHVSARLSE